MADRLLPNAVRDVDGNADDRDRTVFVFNGPPPELRLLDTAAEETAAISAWVSQANADGLRPGEIGLFVRTRAQLSRARAAVEAGGHLWLELSERDLATDGHVSIGTMELAKGLEFKAVAVLAATTACCRCNPAWRRPPTRPNSTMCTRPSGTCSTSPARARGTGW